MVLYLLKSAACMGIFLLFYKLLLEKENMHRFKRFYLLTVLVASLLIPSIVFVEYVVPVSLPNATEIIRAENSTPVLLEDLTSAENIKTNAISNYSQILWCIYAIGLLVCIVRFFRNLFQITNRIRNNPKLKTRFSIHILLQEKLVPHTFFSYIFLNKDTYESKAIPKEVLLHEEAHAIQRHSFDVLLIELLQLVFWFNPLLYLFKKSIKLNHEFLADQAVLEKDIDKTTYQNTILSYVSPDSQKKYQPELANAINYSSIKKRFTIMKTHTSKKAILLRSFLLLPLLALSIYGFSETNVVEVQPERSSSIVQTPITETIWIDIKNENELWYKNELINLEDLSAIIINNRNNEKEQPQDVQIYSTGILRASFLNEVTTEIKKAGITEIKVFTEKYIMQEEAYQDRIAITPGTVQLKANKMSFTKTLNKKAQKKLERINRLPTNNIDKVENSKPANFEIIVTNTQKGLKLNCTNGCAWKELEFTLLDAQRRQIDEFGLHSNSQNKKLKEKGLNNFLFTIRKVDDAIEMKSFSGIIWIDLGFTLPMYKSQKFNQFGMLSSPNQEGASRKLMAEYNKLAKHYNTISPNHMQIKKNDVDRLTYIHGLMYEKQKTDAEPFPDFPPMPEPPVAPKAIKTVKPVKPIKATKVFKGVKSDIPPPPNAPEETLALVQKIIKEQDPYDTTTLSRIQVSNVDNPPNKTILQNPPSPPAPIEPLDYVIKMAKKDAQFFYKDKEITSDEAIKLMKNNKDINIDSRDSKGKRPIVKLSKEPIKINN